MKLLYILKSFAVKAGTERVISDKINYLAERGYEIVLVTYEQGTHPYAFPLHPSVRFIDLDTRFFKVDQRPIYMRPLLLLKLRRQFCQRFQQLINEVRPDIIISTTYSIKLMDIILSVKTYARHLVESHVACFTVQKSYDYRHLPFVRNLASIYDSYILGQLKRCDKLVVLTEGDATEWRRYASHVLIIPNPVTYYPNQVPEHKNTQHRIICVGRLHEQKGYDLLIKAFAIIASKCPKWRLDIYGTGGAKTSLEQQIHQCHLEDWIQILPPIQAIYDEYQRSDFLVLSSRYEGFGLVLVEAMSCGIPCVSFRCKYGPEDIITDHVDGLLAKDGDVNDLADKMLWMIQHREERLAMGRKARENVRRYDKTSIMQQWMDLLDSLPKAS